MPSGRRSSAAAVRAAADAAAEQINGGSAKYPETVTLENGIVLRFKAFPSEMVRRVADKLPEPEVPVVMNEDKGREEPNPNDPTYLRAVAQHQQDAWSAAVDVMIAAGTEIESVPEGLHRPEGNQWLELAQHFGVEVEVETPLSRYISWVQLYAIAGSSDWMKVLLPLIQRAGMSEEEVARAVKSFRGGALWRADTEVPGEVAGYGGDVPAPS